MGGLLFVTQAMLDSWAEQGKIDFVGNVMTLLGGGGGRSYALEPAVRFMKLLGADADPHGLLHKVKSVTQLREMGAEPAEDSCILGDVAYEVQPGFLAEAAALEAAATAPAAPRPAAAAPSSRAEAERPAPAPPPSAARAAVQPGTVPEATTSSALPPAGRAPSPSVEPRSRPLGSSPLPRDLEERRKEAEALARFLLENLS